MIKANKDNDISINFKPRVDCLGEKIIGEFFEIGQASKGSANAIAIDAVGAIEGDLTTEQVTFIADTTSLDEQSFYSIVLRTEETGVIYVDKIYINNGYN